jgi:hypothetical protein
MITFSELRAEYDSFHRHTGLLSMSACLTYQALYRTIFKHRCLYFLFTIMVLRLKIQRKKSDHEITEETKGLFSMFSLMGKESDRMYRLNLN